MTGEGPLTLRKADPRDSEFAYGTKRAAFREYVEKVEGWDEDEQRRLHERRFATQDFRVVTLVGTDVGSLRVLKVNPRARAFYERLGFVRTGETETHDLMEWTA